MKNKERIFIVPTRFGFMYGMGIIVTLSAGVIYANNLVFLLCFFLVALVLIAMYQTNSNLKGIQVDKIVLNLTEAKRKGFGKIWLKGTSSENKNQVKFELNHKGKNKIDFVISQIKRQGLTIDSFSFVEFTRGKKNIQKVKLSTVFPFGLFYAWRIMDVTHEYYIFPEQSGRRELPNLANSGDSLESLMGKKGDDFTQHLKYQPGHSQKHIDWKAFAKGRPLLIKEFSDGDRQAVVLDYSRLAGGRESRLQQLATWVEQCEKQNLNYQLKLENVNIGPAVGSHHRNQCLRALASFPELKSA